MSPCIQVLGAYKLELTDSLFAQAMEWKYGGLSLSQAERLAAEAHVRAELGAVALIEVHVQGRDGSFSVSDFSQPGSDQCAYMEVYLSADGCALIGSDIDVPCSPDYSPVRLDIAPPLVKHFGVSVPTASAAGFAGSVVVMPFQAKRHVERVLEIDDFDASRFRMQAAAMAPEEDCFSHDAVSAARCAGQVKLP